MESTKLQKRARRKYKNNPLLNALVHLPDSPNNKAYTRSYFCANDLLVDVESKVKGRYCKNRCCIICNSIRSQVRYEKYTPYLTGQLQFTTLTVPNCTLEEYPEVTKKLKKTFWQIRNTIKKRGTSIFGISNIEETINLQDGTIHPHIHIIHSPVKTHIIGHAKQPYLPKSENDVSAFIGGYKQGTRQEIYYGNEITDLHLKHHPLANPFAQKVIPVTDSMNMRELFKYTTKPFDFSKKRKNQTDKEYKYTIQNNFSKYVYIYDQLYTLKKGLRFFEAFNLKTVELTEIEENNEMAKTAVLETTKPHGYYSWQVHDWVNVDGETLADFIPTEKQIKANEVLNSRPLSFT